MIIILFYDKPNNKKNPAVYILCNHKAQKGYELIFDKVKNILTLENTEKLKWGTITVDFILSLINAINKILYDIRLVGCLFHYIKNVRLNALKYVY